jgi:hypothetical protein
MERRSADDAQPEGIANLPGEDDGQGREAGQGGHPLSLTGRYLPRLVVSAAALILIV